MNFKYTIMGVLIFESNGPPGGNGISFISPSFVFISVANSANMVSFNLVEGAENILIDALENLSLKENRFLTGSNIRIQCACIEPREYHHCYLDHSAADKQESVFFRSGISGLIADYYYCECCLVCFWKIVDMGRAKGAPNQALSRAEYIKLLKDVALLNEHGRVSDGTLMKDISKNMLKDMVSKAGLEGMVQNLIIKKNGGNGLQQTQLSMGGSAGNKEESIINLSDVDTPNFQVQQEDSDEESDLPPIQGATNEGNQPVIQPVILSAKSKGNWTPDLIGLGYGSIAAVAPNKAVQLILGCIKDPEIHNHFIMHENTLGEYGYSAIMFLGANNMLALATKFRECAYDIDTCISDTYARLLEALYEATSMDCANVTTYIHCLTALEKANGIKVTNPPLNRATVKPPPKSSLPVSLDTCLFDLDSLTEFERNAILGIGPSQIISADSSLADPAEEYKLRQLNLANCSCFPIISARLVESFGQRYEQALWRSKNLGIIAPLSLDSLVKLAGITPDEIKCAYYEADNLIRSVDRLEVDLPFSTNFFGKECSKGDGFLMGQKDHMAKAEEKRNDFYLKKIWRTHCPYIKCNCQKYTRGKKECLDGGIKWIDHALWYLMNNLEVIWPAHSPTVRFALFSSILRSSPMRTAIIAYVGYLRVRGLLIDMTKRYADDQTANLNAEFGNTKLTEVLEKTIRPIKFLLGKSTSNTSTAAHSSKRKLELIDDTDSDIVLPPSVFKKPEIPKTPTGSNLINISDQSSKNTGADGSVSKNMAAGPSRAAGMQGNKISF